MKEFTKVQSSNEAMIKIATEIATCTSGMLSSASALVPLIGQEAAGLTALSKTMVALPIKRKLCLFQFDYSGAPEEATAELPFIALGSGQPIADPFLAFLKRILWKDHRPTV